MSAPTFEQTIDLSGTAPLPFGRLVGVELRKTADTRAGRWLLISMAALTALVMVIQLAVVVVQDISVGYADFMTSTSFSMDLRRWLEVTEAYTQGSTPYHTTLPTDTLAHDAALMVMTRDAGLETLRRAQSDLGAGVRAILDEHGFPSVAADGFAAPSVVVSFTDDPEIRSGAKFKQLGVQVAAGVPLMCGERDDFSTFRVGLFGLDKLGDVDGTIGRLEARLLQLRG